MRVSTDTPAAAFQRFEKECCTPAAESGRAIGQLAALQPGSREIRFGLLQPPAMPGTLPPRAVVRIARGTRSGRKSIRLREPHTCQTQRTPRAYAATARHWSWSRRL